MDQPVRLKFDREYSNMKDKDASLVWVPDIDSFEEEDKSFIVHERNFLMLADIAGLQIGHVPQGLSSAMRQLLDKDCYIFAIPTGKAIPSFPPPWPHIQEKKGGMVIPSQYVVRWEKMAISAAKAILKNAINEMQEKDAYKLRLCWHNVRI